MNNSELQGLEDNKVYLSKNPILIKAKETNAIAFRDFYAVDLQVKNNSKVSVNDLKKIRLYAYGKEMIIDLSPYINALLKKTDGSNAVEKNDAIPYTMNHFTIVFTVVHKGTLLGEEYFYEEAETREIFVLNGGTVSDKINVEAPKDLVVPSPFYLDDDKPIGFGVTYNSLDNKTIVSKERKKEDVPIKYYKHSGLEYPLKIKFINRYGGYSFLAFEDVIEKTDVSKVEIINKYYDFDTKTIRFNNKQPTVNKSYSATVELESFYHDLLEDLISSDYIVDTENHKQLILEDNTISITGKTIDFEMKYTYISQYK